LAEIFLGALASMMS